MADWFVVVEPRPGEAPTEVFEFIEYRQAVRQAHSLAESMPDRYSIEVVDYEGRVVRSVDADFEGTGGFVSVPLRAGLYRWQEASDTYREVAR